MKVEMLILIFCSVTEPRRIKAIFNVLIGKKTVSNLYWGFNYGLLDYLDGFHGFKIDNLDAEIKRMKQAGLIFEPAQNFIQLTSDGELKREALLERIGDTNLLMIAGHYDVSLFKKRIILATQVVSEYSYQNTHYYPQSVDLLNDSLIKRWFINNKSIDLIELIKHGWQRTFEIMPPQLANHYAQTLIGHARFGQTTKQIADQTGFEPDEVWLWLYIGDCLMVREFANLHNPALELLFQGIEKDQLSHSALLTRDMFLRSRNQSLAEIASKRQVKITTVKEHLLECAILLTDPRPLFKLVLSRQAIVELDKRAPQLVTEWKFDQTLEKQLNIDFFEFRMYQIMRSRENGS